MALLHYFTEFTYNVVLKQLLGLHPFQNLLLIVYDHIDYDLRDYSAIIWAKQQEAIVSTSDCSCPSRCLLMNFLSQWARPFVVRSGLDGRVHFKTRFEGYVGSVDA